jgi:hypothetical protein
MTDPEFPSSSTTKTDCRQSIQRISKLYGGVVKLYGGEPWGSDEKNVKNEFKMKA